MARRRRQGFLVQTFCRAWSANRMEGAGENRVMLLGENGQEVVVISDSSQEADSVEQSVVESCDKEPSVDFVHLLKEAENSVRNVCSAVQNLRIALASVLEEIESAMEVVDRCEAQDVVFERGILRSHLNLSRALLIKELRELELVRRRHDLGGPNLAKRGAP